VNLHGNRPPSDLDSTPTTTTTRCTRSGSRHRLDRRRQKDGVSNPKQGRRRPESNATAPVQQRPVQKTETDSDKDAVTHGRRYAEYIRPTTPSDNFCGYSHSLQSNSYLNSATIVHRLTKTISRRTFTLPLTHVHPYRTTLSGHLIQVSH